MNLRAARLHVLSDLAGSVAAVSAGVLVGITGQPRIDAGLSLVIVALVAFGALRLLREAGMTLMAHVPGNIDLAEVDAALRDVPGVLAVHDLHCWSLTSDLVALTCHLQLRATADPAEATRVATEMLRERFGIGHITIQAEPIALLDPSQPPPEATGLR
jgi:cobalt-zinc-cadmium efflux system protein